MKITPYIHRKLWFISLLKSSLLLAMLILLAWLSTRYTVQFDLTANHQNTLTPTTLKTIEKLPGPVHIRVLIHETALQQQIGDLLARYQRIKPNLSIEYLDPDSHPELSKQYKLGRQGAVIVEYQGKHEKITYLSESSLTNALLQLASKQTLFLSFLSGHGERDLLGRANFDLGQFGAVLEKRGFKPQPLNLAKIGAIPDNSSLLVLADPRIALLPAEIQLITDYLEQGGNLLLLTEPGNTFLQPILHALGITTLPGHLASQQSTLYGIKNPEFIVISDYPPHPVTFGFQEMTLFPGVAALTESENTEFTPQRLLMSDKQSWTELAPPGPDNQFDADSQELTGPLPFAYSLTRALKNARQQRIIITGDADFLSNAYLDNVGNLELGMRMLHWLTHNDSFIDIPPRDTVGKTLQFSDLTLGLISTFFLLILPALLGLSGFIIWRRRKNH